MSFDMSCSRQAAILRLRTERSCCRDKENKIRAKAKLASATFRLEFHRFFSEQNLKFNIGKQAEAAFGINAINCDSLALPTREKLWRFYRLGALFALVRSF
jgi:hypothetical protein